MLVPLLILLLELVAIRALAPVFVLMFDRRTQNRVVTQLVGPAILLGYIGGGTVAWSLVPPEWQMSFRETLAASVNAEKYGHPIEHYAQDIVVMTLFACAVGALIGGILAATTARVWKRPPHA
jgi:hypothetical protein